MKTKLAFLLSTWFYAGYSPFAPGTAGSLAAILIAVVLHRYLDFGPWHFALMAALLFYPAVQASTIAARAATLNWKSFLAAFVLFRLFDIWKPAPVRQLEALPEGLGINADDAMAGVYAALVLRLAGWFNLYSAYASPENA